MSDWRDVFVEQHERARLALPFVLVMGLAILGAAAVTTGLARREELAREAAVQERAEAAAALEALVDQAWRGVAGPTVAELRARVDAERPLGGAETKLLALEGLVAVAGGDLDRARGLAELLDARRAGRTPHARALRGALAAAAGDPHEAMDELTRAIDAGLAHPDLRGWRGVARVREGLPVPALAREAITDLDAAASVRPLRQDEQAARAQALQALQAAQQE